MLIIKILYLKVKLMTFPRWQIGLEMEQTCVSVCIMIVGMPRRHRCPSRREDKKKGTERKVQSKQRGNGKKKGSLDQKTA